jgi:hypothetical protein
MIEDKRFYDTNENINRSENSPKVNPLLAYQTTKSLSQKSSPYVFQRFIEGQKRFMQEKTLNLSQLQRSVDELILGELRQIPSISPQSKHMIHNDSKVPAYERLCNMGIHNCKNIIETKINTTRTQKNAGPPSCYYSKRAKTPQKEISCATSVTPSLVDLKSKFAKEIKGIVQNISGESTLSKAECMDLFDQLGLIANTLDEKELRENLYFRLSLCSIQNVCQVLFSIIYNLASNEDEAVPAEEIHSLHNKFMPLLLNRMNAKAKIKPKVTDFSYRPLINPPVKEPFKSIIINEVKEKRQHREEILQKRVKEVPRECTFQPCILPQKVTQTDSRGSVLLMLSNLINGEPRKQCMEENETTQYTFHPLENPPILKVEVHGFEQAVKRLNVGREEKRRVDKITSLRASHA